VPLIVAISMIVFGLWLLTWSANRFVDGSAVLAANPGVSQFVIGNIVGSNLFNTLAVVGVSGLVRPFSCEERYFCL
jgi:cation:H+ antiporter